MAGRTEVRPQAGFVEHLRIPQKFPEITWKKEHGTKVDFLKLIWILKEM